MIYYNIMELHQWHQRKIEIEINLYCGKHTIVCMFEELFEINIYITLINSNILKKHFEFQEYIIIIIISDVKCWN